MSTTSGTVLHFVVFFLPLGTIKWLLSSWGLKLLISCPTHWQITTNSSNNLIIVAAEMIHSLFLINHSGDIFLEKHWKSVISRSVCDYFFDVKEKAVDPENVPPVLQTPHHYLITIYRGKLFFLSVVQTEVPPLFVIEFLHRVADTIQVWFYRVWQSSPDVGNSSQYVFNIPREAAGRLPPTIRSCILDLSVNRSSLILYCMLIVGSFCSHRIKYFQMWI